MKDTDSRLDSIRHSLAHVLAMAVLKKFPDAKLGIGPTIEHGFYYDFLLPAPLSDADLPELEATMREIISQKLGFTGEPVTQDQASAMFQSQPFKLELLNEFSKEGKQLTAYHTGTFTDLCRGGHIENTSEINPSAFKLTKVAGAYWRGSEKNPQLTRIYGAAFETPEELEKHLVMIAEAEKRDHRKLGKELKLFTISPEVGPGLPLFYPKGAILRRTIEEYIIRKQEALGYVPIVIPHVTRGELYNISGHLSKYDALFPPMHLDDEEYYVKPMNCPHFMMLYKSEPHSYRDLPLRYTATTMVYRNEKSGELSGLTRVRSITQDDCHVFCTEDQVPQELETMIGMISEVYRDFGFDDFYIRLSFRDPKDTSKYIGSDELWAMAEGALTDIVKKHGLKHEIGLGEAAFYGPKIDYMVKDALGREWQLSTIQLDVNLPERFGLEYTDAEGTKKRPIVLHRAVTGSTERFMGILIEHYAGAFPYWLAPVQVAILPVNDKVADYCADIEKRLKDLKIRVETNTDNETIGKKIRSTEMQKIPYMIVVGEKEKAAGNVSVRAHGGKDLGQLTLDDFIATAGK